MTTKLNKAIELSLQETPGFQAKNRFGLDAEMPFDWSAIREQMLK